MIMAKGTHYWDRDGEGHFLLDECLARPLRQDRYSLGRRKMNLTTRNRTGKINTTIPSRFFWHTTLKGQERR